MTSPQPLPDPWETSCLECDLRCAECRTAWVASERTRWLAYLTDDEPPVVVLYCPPCASWEFGDR